MEGNDQMIIDFAEYRLSEKSSFQYRANELTKNLESAYSEEFKVRQRLKKRHPLIKQLGSQLNKSYERNGLIHTFRRDCLYVSVSKNHKSRFLRMIETFITMIELRGHSIKPGHKKSSITVKGQTFGIRFIEKSNRKTVSGGLYPSTTLMPNGKLSIKVTVSWRDKEWIDGYHSLEENLPKILAYLASQRVIFF